MGFTQQEYWRGLPFPPPGDLPDPGIKLASLLFPALAGRFLTAAPPGKPLLTLISYKRDKKRHSDLVHWENLEGAGGAGGGWGDRDGEHM